MAVANGPGQQISGGGMAVPAGARVVCWIKPLLFDASGNPLVNPGGPDSKGNYLHIRYSGNLNLRSRSGGNQIPGGVPPLDFVQNKIVVEFDAQSTMTFPHEGMIELVGGVGQYLFGFDVDAITDTQFYQPVHRWLQTFVPLGGTFTVPDWHTFILATNSATRLLDPVSGVQLEPSVLLPGNSVISGQQFIVPQNTVIKTGWYG